MRRLILLRHGESQWNADNRFTGWADVDLTSSGEAQAEAAGKLLRDHSVDVETALTSMLTRAIRALWIVLQVRGSHRMSTMRASNRSLKRDGSLGAPAMPTRFPTLKRARRGRPT